MTKLRDGGPATHRRAKVRAAGCLYMRAYGRRSLSVPAPVWLLPQDRVRSFEFPGDTFFILHTLR